MNRKTKTRTPYYECQICGRKKPFVKDTPFPVVVSLWDTQHHLFNGDLRQMGQVESCASCTAQLVVHGRCLSPLHKGLATSA
ncbi:MAG: hypothetical protein O7E52_14425 [Candidatus Poribacteria bacterium]|nr:hypothetical protein [Candidatus Poribacteria bacterium]